METNYDESVQTLCPSPINPKSTCPKETYSLLRTLIWQFSWCSNIQCKSALEFPEMFQLDNISNCCYHILLFHQLSSHNHLVVTMDLSLFPSQKINSYILPNIHPILSSLIYTNIYVISLYPLLPHLYPPFHYTVYVSILPFVSNESVCSQQGSEATPVILILSHTPFLRPVFQPSLHHSQYLKLSTFPYCCHLSSENLDETMTSWQGKHLKVLPQCQSSNWDCGINVILFAFPNTHCVTVNQCSVSPLSAFQYLISICNNVLYKDSSPIKAPQPPIHMGCHSADVIWGISTYYHFQYILFWWKGRQGQRPVGVWIWQIGSTTRQPIVRLGRNISAAAW